MQPEPELGMVMQRTGDSVQGEEGRGSEWWEGTQVSGWTSLGSEKEEEG